MAFMKNIIDLRGILTLTLLTLPSIAANVNCNGKPFHCVNSTHFMICVDLGSGVSSTIDDFVIPCPPTTVCQGTNRFECEFPAITTTAATSVAPLVASVSETIVTVTTPIYEVITSIPFEEYYNTRTLSTTTISEDVLMTHQTIATEPTVTESTIQRITETTVTESTIQRITDETKNIEVSGYESNSTLSETIQNADVVQNDFITPLPDNTSANVTEPIPDTTETVNVTIPGYETSSVLSETMPSIKVIHKNLTTLTPLLNNISTSAADLIPNATEYLIVIIPESETNSSINDTNLSVTDNAQNEPTHYASTGSALPIFADTTTASILTEVAETALGESVLSDTNPSVDITLPELTIFTPLPDNIRANATVLNLDDIESSNVLPDFKTNSILTDSISSVIDAAQNETLFTSDSSTMIISTADRINSQITESILSQITETTPSVSTFKKTFPIVDFIQNDVTTIPPLPDNISANTTDLIPNSTENVHVEPTYLATLLPNSLSVNATYQIAEVTDSLNEKMSESETNSSLSETIPVKTKLVENHAPLDTLGSNSLSINIADTVTESILLEVKKITPSVYINVVKNYVTTLNTSSNTALPDKIVDIVHESVITGMTENALEAESNLNLSGSTQSMPLADISQGDHTTLLIPSKTVMPSNITTESTVSDVTANINIASTESIYKSSTKTIPIETVDFVKFHPTATVFSSTASLSNTNLIVPRSVITNETKNTNVVEAESKSNLTLRRNLTGGNDNIVQTDIPPLSTQHTIAVPNTSEPVSNDNVLNTLINEINKANATDNQYSIETDSNRTIKAFLTPSAEASQTISTMTDSNITVETTPNSNVETTVPAQIVRSITVRTNTENIGNNQESNQIDRTTVLNEQVLTTGKTVSVTAPMPILVVVRNENIFASTLVTSTDSDIPVPHPTTKVTFTPTTDTLTVNESPFLTTNQESNIPGVTTLGGETNDIVLPLTTIEHNNTSKSFNVNASEWLVPKHADNTESSNYLPLPHLFPNTEKLDDIEERPPLTDYNLQQSTNSPVDLSTVPTINITVISGFKAAEQTTMATTFTVADTSEVFFSETLPKALSFENTTVKDDLNRAKENGLNDKNSEHNTNTSSPDSNVTSNDVPKLPAINSQLTNTDNFVPLYPITEIIMTEFENNSHVESPKNIQSSKSKLYNVTALTQSTMSSLLVDNIQSEILSVFDIIPDIATTATVVGDSGLNINSRISKNTKEAEETLKPKIIAPELINSSFQTELPVENSAKTKAVTKTPAMLTETSVTNIIGVGNSVTSVTESSPMDEGDFTVRTADANVMMWSNDKTVSIGTEAKEENNLLINLLLNSPVKQITKVPTNEISLDSIQIQKDTKNNTSTNKIFSGDSSTHVNGNVLSVGLAQQELYTESIIKHMDTNLQTPLSNNIFSVTEVPPSAIIPDIQKGTQVTSDKHTHTLDITSQSKESAGFEKFHQSPVGRILIRPPNQDITTEKKINSIPIMDILEPPQAPTENYYRVNTSKTNQITVLEQASIDNAKTNPTQDVFITKSKPIRTVGLNEVKGINTLNTAINIENEALLPNENVMLPKQAQNTETNNSSTFDQHIEVSKPSQNTITVESQISQGTSTEFQPEITMIPSDLVTFVQDTATANQNKDSSDTTTAVSVTEALKTTVITKPYIEITSQLITEQSDSTMIQRTSTEAQGKTPMISDTTSQTLSKSNVEHDVSIPELKAQYATSIIDENLGIGVKPKNELTTGTWSQVTRASEITDDTISKPNLVKVASNLRVEQHTMVRLPTPETKFINISKDVVTQSTRQEVTLNPLNTNRDADIVILDVVKTNVPVLEENILLTSTHSGISVLQKPPRKEQNEKPESSESVEGFGVVKKERDFEASESNEGVNNVTTTIRDTTHDSSSSKTSTGQVNEQSVNEKIDLIGTPKMWDYRLPFKTNKMSLNSTIDITTKKVDENSNSGYQTIINIELLSTNVKSTENFEPSKVARGGSTDSNEKSTNNESTKNASIVSNVTANITEHNRARDSPKTKSQFANTHNESVPAFESTANSFVCKQNSRGRISDSKDCRKFYICIGKPEPIEGLCPNNTVFSELRKQCTKNLSHCVRNNQFHCTSEGRFSDYLNDNIYYICVKNNVGKFIRFKLQCQSDYHLNKTSVRCALNTEASQSTSQQSKSDISKNNSDQNEFSGKSEKLVAESIKKIECMEEGRFPDPNDCRKYYVCVKRRKSQYRRKSKKCDSDELFHKDKKKCVDADSYECS